MTQAERDRLVTLKKAKKRLITQREAAEELDVTVRHAKRLLWELKKRGDKAVIHGLRGRPSPRRIAAATEQEAVKILSDAMYQGFGPTLACEYLRIYLIAMIDDATSRLYARFVSRDSTEENMRVLWGYLEQYGRPVAFYTDKASLFETAEKRRRDEPGVDKDASEMPPTQIGRALRELGTGWIAAHSPQAKGRVERGFSTAQDRLVKGLRVAAVSTMEGANAYLEGEFLPWWNQTLAVEPANAEDAHRGLGKEHDLAAILSHVEQRQVSNGYTVQYQGK